MQHVFLIHAHKDIDQLNQLIGLLCDPDFLVYVYLDRNSALDPGALHPFARCVAPRVPVRWGTLSQVRASLVSLRQILREAPAFDKLVFLSAQDVPLLPNALLKRELARLRGSELIEVTPIAPHGWRVMARYQYFHCEGGGALLRLACTMANGALRLLGRTRRFPRGFAPYGGSAWWALSRDCLVELLRLADAHPRLLRFCRSVRCPDELFFQTLVMHSRFAPQVLPENFRYVDWPDRHARNPKLLVDDDFERIRASHAHFCRKLDSRVSAGLARRIAAWRDERTA
jgi:hypothetical protein